MRKIESYSDIRAWEYELSKTIRHLSPLAFFYRRQISYLWRKSEPIRLPKSYKKLIIEIAVPDGCVCVVENIMVSNPIRTA
jgi:hypothetical protein